MTTSSTRRRRAALVGVPLAIVSLLTTAAEGGCGSNGKSTTPGHTSVQIQGNPASTHKCTVTLIQREPVDKQLTATLTVTCNFPLASASTSLVIQGRPIGGDNTQWDNLSDPKVSSATSGITLTYKVPCVTGLEYQSSASIDGVGVDGNPVSDNQTTTPRSYPASECSGK